MPLIWTSFHVVAPIAVALNMVIAVPLTISLIAGLLAGLTGWIPIVGQGAGTVCHYGLNLIEAIVRWAADVPGGHIWLPAPPWWWVLAFYGLVVGHLILFRREYRWLLGAVLIGWSIVGIGWVASGPRGRWNSWLPSRPVEPELTITFLDVGHGLSVVIEKPDGGVWLYDAGRLGASVQSHRVIAEALWSLGVSRIEQIIVSHADVDHYNAIPGLLERFAVQRVVSTHQFWASGDRNVALLKSALGRARVARAEWQRGVIVQAPEGLRVEVLHPPRNFVVGNDNAASLSMLVQYAGRSLLLTGDLEGTGFAALILQPPRACDLALVPHHGSLTADVQPLLRWCHPRWLVISGGQRTSQPAVSARYQAEGRQLAITFRDGAVQCRVDGTGRLGVSGWDGHGWRPLGSDK